MVAGTSARESVKEMKRLKNEPLLLLVIIAIILFVGIFVIYPVVKVILFPDGGTYLELFNRPRWLTAIKNSLFMTLVSTISCTAVAFLFAYVIARLDVPCKGLFRFITPVSYTHLDVYKRQVPDSEGPCAGKAPCAKSPGQSAAAQAGTGWPPPLLPPYPPVSPGTPGS